MNIKITKQEFAILQSFDSSYQQGWDNPVIDHLACRGLLQRNEKVEPMPRNLTPQHKDNWLADRSFRCHYRLSARGEYYINHTSYVA